MLRRRLMMQSGGGGADYIKDGLAFWMDAEDYDGTHWIDRIQGLDFINQTGNAQYINGGVYANGDDNFKTNNTYVGDLACVECCIKPIDASGKFNVMLSSDNTILSLISSGYGANQMYWKRGERGKKIGINTLDIRTFSANHDFSSIVANLKERSIISEGFPSNSDHYANNGACIGTRLTRIGNLYFGTIYSIRGYTRNLSVEEMMHNQQIDYDLFGNYF